MRRISDDGSSDVRVCLVSPSSGAVSETFIRAHAERLPADVTVVSNTVVPHIAGKPVLSQSFFSRGWRKTCRALMGRSWCWESTLGFLNAISQLRAHAVLAEYGTTGVAVLEACMLAHIPLIVHFHGYDATAGDVIAENRELYHQMFRECAAIVAVSRMMEQRLLELGAPRDKLVYNACGVDCDRFDGADPANSAPVFVAVGRFVEKKAPHLTILAFAEVYREYPQARLRMIGEGPLLGPCRDLATGLGIDGAVSFLGAQPHHIVCEEMQRARAFVQHSVEASTGDCEGTPVAVLEAGACGLPVVATRHAGIPDVIVEGETGLLVDERDMRGMAAHMKRLVESPGLAARLGTAGRERVVTNFAMEQSINRLWGIIQKCLCTPLKKGGERRV